MSQQIQDMDDPARRGTIFDRNGVELAVSEDSVTVFAHPFLIKDPGKTAAKLAPLWGRRGRAPPEALRPPGRLRLPPPQDGRDRRREGEKLRIEGIGTVTEPKRVYPQGFLASQVLGLVGTDKSGLAGLEYSQDRSLRGAGRRAPAREGRARQAGQPGGDEAREAGKNLSLTLDARIQERAEAVLAEVGQTYTPQGATAVVMDPRSGEILALANWPRVDANNIDGAPAYARQNRAIAGELRARLDLQGNHRVGRDGGEARGADTTLAVPPEIQVADRTVGEAHDGGGGIRAWRRSSRSRRTSGR